ncbi:transposase [Azospirillum canadense]|uniref:transposase n=1 Tax=Azospirillum canadense TaxID=403962 RepID=UPI0038734F7D
MPRSERETPTGIRNLLAGTPGCASPRVAPMADRPCAPHWAPNDCLSEADYAHLMRLVPTPQRTGRPRAPDVRPVLDALYHKLRTGCSWRELPPPPHFPPWPTVYGYYRRLEAAGRWPAMCHHLLKAARCGPSASSGRQPVHAIDLQAILSKAQDAGHRAQVVSAQARLALAARKKFAKEAAERLQQMKRKPRWPAPSAGDCGTSPRR